ncbi:MAG: double-strand break repair helicase AddA, partial [Rhizobiaceae bacterium]
KRFPLEANIAGHFDLMDDETGRLLRDQAMRSVIGKSVHGGDEALVGAFEAAIDQAGEQSLKTLLEAILTGASRPALSDFLDGLASGSIDERAIFDAAGLKVGASAHSIASSAWPLKSIPLADMLELIEVAPRSTLKTIQNFAANLEDAINTVDPVRRLKKLAVVFLTEKGATRSSTSYAKEPFLLIIPDFAETFESAANEIRAGLDALNRLEMVRLSKAAHRLLLEVRDKYRALKRARGLLDYEDLIEATRSLLSRDAAAAWVQFKLDQGIEHVLVDEAQDTSPRQWDLVNALTSDFFAGETAADRKRTLFVVGDEKQSIYSFQGARPEVFAETGRQKSVLVRQADQKFESVTLPLSFRSVPEVLKAADLVFEPLRSAGLFGGREPIVHEALRQSAHGRVEVWDRLWREDGDADQDEIENDWTLAVDHLRAPAVLLAREIADTIKAIVNGETNPAKGGRVAPGDILVLVRKRDAFMHALSRELKDRHVPVAGADRLVLTDHIAILDLMAIARVTLQPDDDLSLAALLKSPVFALLEDDLIALSAQRSKGESLMRRLAAKAPGSARMKSIHEQIARWRDEADFVPVHEFFARVLGRDRVRAKLVGRLGGEAADIIDEFLSFALASEKSGIHGLQSFIETLDFAAPEIKRELSGGRNEVRIMTVHGAKGLEAPYVFLVDSGGAPAVTTHAPSLFGVQLNATDGLAPVFLWAPGSEMSNTVSARAKGEALKAQEAEYRRLLYVGMTRAEDVLIVCGYGGKKKPEGTWLELVRAGLDGSPDTVEDIHPVTQRPRLLFSTGVTTDFDSLGQSSAARSRTAFATFLRKPAAPAALPPRPLTPSGTGLSIEDGDVFPLHSPVLDGTGDLSLSIRRGAAVHRLLEMLPQMEARARRAAAESYARRSFPDGEISVDRLITPVFAILDDPRFAALFSPGSKAEISVGGQVMIGGETRMISGKIDRIAVTAGKVIIADYKTNRPAPHILADVPASHIAQLALYAEILKPLYPSHAVEAALIYTEGPHIIALGDHDLKRALDALTAS